MNPAIVSTALLSGSIVVAVIGFLLRYMIKQITNDIDEVNDKHEKHYEELRNNLKIEVEKREETYSKLNDKLNSFVTEVSFKESMSKITDSLDAIRTIVNDLNRHLPESYVSLKLFDKENERMLKRIEKNAESISKKRT